MLTILQIKIKEIGVILVWKQSFLMRVEEFVRFEKQERFGMSSKGNKETTNWRSLTVLSGQL